MHAIITKWNPPGQVRGARYSADNTDFKIYMSERDDLSPDDNHREILRRFCAKRNWTGTLVMGHLAGSARVWVWVNERKLEAESIDITQAEVDLMRKKEGWSENPQPPAFFDYSQFNPDAMDLHDLRRWLYFLRYDKEAREKTLGTSDCVVWLEVYCACKLEATRARITGRINSALTFESMCDHAYTKIPERLRW